MRSRLYLPWLTAAWFVSLWGAASAGGLAGNELPQRARLGTHALVLNGAGTNRRLFFKVYLAGLYLTERRQSSAGVYALAGPKRVSITLARNLPAPELVEALTDGIRANCPPEERQALKDRLDELAARLLAIGQGEKGDVITFDWRPELGTLVSVNGEVKGAAIPGDDVYRALLKVWLGDRPVSAGLKRSLLGQAN